MKKNVSKCYQKSQNQGKMRKEICSHLSSRVLQEYNLADKSLIRFGYSSTTQKQIAKPTNENVQSFKEQSLLICFPHNKRIIHHELPP
jgi:hypothetical protein